MKSNESLKKIGEVSKALDLPIHVIRFWEKKFTVLNPIKKPNGMRYYPVNQMLILKEIKSLLYEKKFSIQGANLVLNKNKNANKEVDALIKEIEGLLVDTKSIL